MGKTSTGGRATFVSPYLRRPLRPLDKAIEDRETVVPAADQPDAAGEVFETVPETWTPTHKRFGTSD